MKISYLSAMSLLAAFIACPMTSPAADAPRPPAPGAALEQASPPDLPINYVVRVDWKSSKHGTNVLQLLTTAGTFKVNTTQASTEKAVESDLPISVSVDGVLKGVDSQKGELQLFLGRSVPFASRAPGTPGPPNVQQRQEGMTSKFVVTFGKPVIIQKDGNGEISVLVERETR